MRIESILVLTVLVVFLTSPASYAQQQGERSQTQRQQDGRYLIYMRGIT